MPRTTACPLTASVAAVLALAVVGCAPGMPPTGLATEAPTSTATFAVAGTPTPTAPQPTPTRSTPPSQTPVASPLIVPASATTTETLKGLDAYIARALSENQASLPRNPQAATEIQGKIAMLQSPTLANEIVSGSRWAQSAGSVTPISLVFPAESMRAEMPQAVRVLEAALRHLEEFLGLPFPAPSVKVWYGFVIGNSGGGGFIFSEDRGTYDIRTGGRAAPFDAILGHELGHSHMGNEALNQLLEMYAYNRANGATTDPTTWTWTRGWVPNAASNSNSLAVLDVYLLLGPETTARAYRAIVPLKPAYGQPLTAAVIQAFVAQVPSNLRAQVEEKLAKISF